MDGGRMKVGGADGWCLRYIYTEAQQELRLTQKEKFYILLAVLKTSFEIQGIVWRHALDSNAPNVHGVEVRCLARGDTGVHMMQDLL